MIFEICILAVLIVSAISDIRKKEVPLWEILGCGAVSAASAAGAALKGEWDIPGILLSLLPGLIMILISRVSREQIGYGDGLLALASGPALGIYDLGLGIVAALFLSGIVSAMLIVFKRAGRRMSIPFVPFMALGLGVMMLAKI